jgi:serine/threonine-protein kinase HipA
MFNGRTPVLNLEKKEFETFRYDFIDHFSISGVQDKISLKLDKNYLVPTDKQGEFILKPVPVQPVPEFQNDIPANEHLTMQIARQVFKIDTAENALISFKDGEPAYITKRFDIRDGNKIRQEDFCQLGGRSPEENGTQFKYEVTVVTKLE